MQCPGFKHAPFPHQNPEQDESYLADSFCVEEEEECHSRTESSEEEEVCVNFDLLADESFTGGRKQYLTRRRVRLKVANGGGQHQDAPLPKKKATRIIVLDDSSEEETKDSDETPRKTVPVWTEQKDVCPPKLLRSDCPAQHRTSALQNRTSQPWHSRCQTSLDLKASVSEKLDFQAESRDRGNPAPLTGADPLRADGNVRAKLKQEGSSKHFSVDPSVTCCSTSKGTAAPAQGSLGQLNPLCILVDSREISSGSEIISSLKAVHGMKVQVCSLGGCDYVVSNRLAVERRLQSEMLNSVNRSKMVRRIQHLQATFERICVIVEKDRVKAGESSRGFQRSKCYDGMLSALLQAGIRILFSAGREETAALLKELALVEHRKNAAIRMPTEVRDSQKAALRFYLSIPNTSYLTALGMCHRFPSVREMANSSPSSIAAQAQVSQQKAEDIYRYLHHCFDPQMLPERPAQAHGR
uniref:ERCC4 domain-containing protein n=1 Tax=Sphenodon punctatus TaxID=8508 RepID=A0A8D0GDI0_SPHPU